MTKIDPPSGWMYGFPKSIPEDILATAEAGGILIWLVEQGYPQSEIDALGENFFCRYWQEDNQSDLLNFPPDKQKYKLEKIKQKNMKKAVKKAVKWKIADKIQVCDWYKNKTKSIKEIADFYHVSKNAIRLIWHRNKNIPRPVQLDIIDKIRGLRPQTFNERFFEKPTLKIKQKNMKKAEDKAIYKIRGLHSEESGKVWNLDHPQTFIVEKPLKIKQKNMKKAVKRWKIEDKIQVCDWYKNKTKSIKEIADFYGVSQKAIRLIYDRNVKIYAKEQQYTIPSDFDIKKANDYFSSSFLIFKSTAAQAFELGAIWCREQILKEPLI